MGMHSEITAATARTRRLQSAEVVRGAAEAAIAAAVRPTLQRHIDAMAAAGAAFRAAEAAEKAAIAEVIRLCGDDDTRKQIEDAARQSVPLPPELRGLPDRSNYITRMYCAWSNGDVTHDYRQNTPPLVDVDGPFNLAKAAGDDKKLRRKLGNALRDWMFACSDAWDSSYNDEQKAAYAAWKVARSRRAQRDDDLERATKAMMRLQSHSPLELALKVQTWAEAWAIRQPDGGVDTEEMEEDHNAFVLAALAADLLRLNAGTAGRQ